MDALPLAALLRKPVVAEVAAEGPVLAEDVGERVEAVDGDGAVGVEDGLIDVLGDDFAAKEVVVARLGDVEGKKVPGTFLLMAEEKGAGLALTGTLPAQGPVTNGAIGQNVPLL